ncbi:MAG: hypothetical protein HY749_23105 [Gammaproteobacteria bacterium]|nr:hypothetical protein [Gammaproteobacteria bacterium]MBI5618221.1 hypothetical protein [Gammaproteobacteria bacterium]
MDARPVQGRINEAILLQILQSSPSMVGLCLAAIGILRVGKHKSMVSIEDAMLAIAALLFLVACFTAYWALRSLRRQHAGALCHVVDVSFFVALTLMVLAGFLSVFILV